MPSSLKISREEEKKRGGEEKETIDRGVPLSHEVIKTGNGGGKGAFVTGVKKNDRKFIFKCDLSYFSNDLPSA